MEPRAQVDDVKPLVVSVVLNEINPNILIGQNFVMPGVYSLICTAPKGIGHRWGTDFGHFGNHE